ncbi:MAG: aminoglycoside phosphotransferase family protein [Dehalococcoidia bacterium]
MPRMHVDEVDIDDGLVRRLVDAQFPRWRDLPLEAVTSAGTVHALYRLGDDMVVRLPRRPAAVPQLEKEQDWLPRLAPHLPLPVPVPLARGRPTEDYPNAWAVVRWLEGETADRAPLNDPFEAARALGEFIRALHAVDATGGPEAGAITGGRGAPLALRDASIRGRLDDLRAGNFDVDIEAATAAWDDALAAPAWDGPPVWFHGDLLPGNLLLEDGRIAAVIDFGQIGVGDPACDLVPAWSVLPAEARDTFRGALDVDDATWNRGRGWALFVGLSGLPYYHETNPAFAALCRRMIEAVLADPDWR